MVLIHNLKVLFLDEPFETIDRLRRSKFKDLLVMVAFYLPPGLYEIVRAQTVSGERFEHACR
jgi:hypothetical protein